MDKKDIIIYTLMVLIIIAIGIIGYLLKKDNIKKNSEDISSKYSEYYTLDNKVTPSTINETIE